MEYYGLIKAIHLISIIIWVSSLVYLSKSLNFHKESIVNQNYTLIKKLKNEQKIIYRYVMSLSFVIATIFGITLVYTNAGLLESGFWIYIKLFLISLLAINHHICKIYMNDLEKEILIEDKKFDFLSYSTIIIISLIVLLTITKVL